MRYTSSITLSFLVTLLSVIGRGESYAEDVTHTFHDMYGSTLIVSGTPEVGVTDFVTYRCNNTNVKFDMDHVNKVGTKVISLVFSKGAQMTTTAVENLKELTLFHRPADDFCTNLKIALSTDSTDGSWRVLSAEDGDDIAYHKGSIIAKFPKGKYYIRMTNAVSDKVSVTMVRYTVINCNCFPYETEK